MSSATTTTTTTAADGTTTTVEAVENWIHTEESTLHTTLTNWTTHLKTLSASAGWLSFAYAAYTFARHMV